MLREEYLIVSSPLSWTTTGGRKNGAQVGYVSTAPSTTTPDP